MLLSNIKKNDDIIMHPDESSKKERNSKSKDKRKESSQYDDSDARKEKRLGRKRVSKQPIVNACNSFLIWFAGNMFSLFQSDLKVK